MRAKRGVVRGVSLTLVGVIAMTVLAGCARKSEDFDEQLAQDPAVASVEMGDDGEYRITLDDSTSPKDLAEVSDRLSELAESTTDDEVELRLRLGGWQWAVADEAAGREDLARAVGELAAVDGILRGEVWANEKSLSIEAIAEAGVDPAAVVTPLADAAAAGPLSDGVSLKVSDVHERSSVETQKPDELRAALESIPAVAAVGPIQKYLLSDDSLILRMRTPEAAALASPLVTPLADGESPLEVNVTGGLVTTPVLQEELAGRVAAVLTPIDGVIGASIDTHGPKALHLSVTTTDAASATAAEQALLASPDLPAFNSLQLFVLKDDEPGTRVTAKTMSDAGFVGNFDAALTLADTEGVDSVAFGPLELDIVIEEGADPVDLAPAIKAVALRGQETEIFRATSWGPHSDRTVYNFTVTGNLHPNLVEGRGDHEDEFIDAWNDAPAL